MCGIVGVMNNKLMLSDYLKFKDLFTIAQLRGDEGAGLISVPDKGVIENVKVRKTTWSSGHLATTSDWDEVIKGDNTILIGHARQPTKGGTKIENVHPHRSHHILLVHNGTMSTVDNSTIGVNESDSKKIADCIAKKGIRHFVDNSFGAYCLIWIDLEKQTLNFLRNEERPLYLFEQTMSKLINSTITHLWWASEFWMVPTVLGRYSGFDKELLKGYALPLNMHLEFPLSVPFSIPEPAQTEIKRKVNYSSAVYDQAWWEYEDNQDPLSSRGANSGGTSASSASSTKLPAVITSTSGSSGKSEAPSQPFRYTPPEKRDNSKQSVFKSAGSIIASSKVDADLNVKRKETAVKSAGTFQCSETKIEGYAEKQHKRVLDLISRSKCVWCGDKPLIIDGVTPKIYPVRFSEGRDDYVCNSCISDLDVQRMVGIS